jgi:hypothetical protein
MTNKSTNVVVLSTFLSSLGDDKYCFEKVGKYNVRAVRVDDLFNSKWYQSLIKIIYLLGKQINLIPFFPSWVSQRIIQNINSNSTLLIEALR